MIFLHLSCFLKLYYVKTYNNIIKKSNIIKLSMVFQICQFIYYTKNLNMKKNKILYNL